MTSPDSIVPALDPTTPDSAEELAVFICEFVDRDYSGQLTPLSVLDAMAVYGVQHASEAFMNRLARNAKGRTGDA